MTEPGPGRLFTRSFLFLSLADVAYFTGAGMLVTATPLFVSDRLGGGNTGVGLAFGAFSVATLVVRPWRAAGAIGGGGARRCWWARPLSR